MTHLGALVGTSWPAIHGWRHRSCLAAAACCWRRHSGAQRANRQLPSFPNERKNAQLPEVRSRTRQRYPTTAERWDLLKTRRPAVAVVCRVQFRWPSGSCRLLLQCAHATNFLTVCPVCVRHFTIAYPSMARKIGYFYFGLRRYWLLYQPPQY